MTEQQGHRSNSMNEQRDSDNDDQEDEEEFIFTTVIPLLDEDPVEETIDLNLLLPHDLERLRRTDPFMFHSIMSDMSGYNTVCTVGVMESDSPADIAAGGAISRADNMATSGSNTSLRLSRSRSLPQLRVRNASNMDRRLSFVGGSLGTVTGGTTARSRSRSLSPMTNNTRSSGNTNSSIDASMGLRRSHSLSQMRSTAPFVSRVVRRRRRFSTEIYAPDISHELQGEVGRLDLGGGGGSDLFDDFLSNVFAATDDSDAGS